jgi:hypothetical protein
MKPRNESNFLVEITPEVMDELNRLYMHSDEEPIAELHYSPYWKNNQPQKDTRPHSRACGWQAHPHGSACSSNCPTCHGKEHQS